jgi:hypothetical protein
MLIDNSENVVPKVDLDGTGVERSFLCCIKFLTARRQDALEFICGPEEIKHFTRKVLRGIPYALHTTGGLIKSYERKL